MGEHRKYLYIEIVRRALLNIRLLGERGQAKGCAIEADHVHNIPELLMTEDPGKEKYYWDIERKLYLAQQSDKRLSAVFEPIWSELQGTENEPA